MKPQTRISAATMALMIAGIAPAFGATSPTAIAPTSTTTTASPTTTTNTGATTTATTGTGTTSTTTMNKGQTDIATSLAKAQLAQYGITQPTAQQLDAALNGGTITTGTGAGAKTVQLKGVLTQRAAGQGWGQIANSLGLKLGKVVSAEKSKQREAKENEIDEKEDGKKRIKTASGSSERRESKENKRVAKTDDDAGYRAKGTQSKRITTAAGTTSGYNREHGKSASAGVTTAAGRSDSGYRDGKRYGAGIVTASGGSYTATSRASEHGAGIVTASSGGSSGASQGRSDDGGSRGKSGK